MARVLVILLGATLLAFLAWQSGDVAKRDEFAAATEATERPFESRMVTGADGVKIHAAFIGPDDGEPVVLIHGFPEFWYSWRFQAAYLADQGFRVMVPDLRGYNRSDKPRGRDKYDVADYAQDIVAAMDALGWQKAHLAGHDVGAGVAWYLAYEHADRIDRAVVFNIPPPQAWAKAVAAGGESTSWYRTAFKVPFLPELALRTLEYRVLVNTFKEDAAAGAFSDDDIAIYQSAWARDNAISTMLGFYRADGVDFANALPTGAPEPRTLFIGSAGDRYVPDGSLDATEDLLGSENVEVWQNTSHWVLQEEPSLSASTMADWFRDDG